MNSKRKTSFILTAEAKRLLELLAKKYGLTQTAMLETLIREKARQNEIWK